MPLPQQNPSLLRPTARTRPLHVAIIMDGNGRWARLQGLPRTAGHTRGADTLRAVIEACRDKGVSHLTVYAFSSENWKRPPAEISDLMQLLKIYLNKEVKALHENKVRLRFIGDLSLLAPDVRVLVENAATLTGSNSAFHLTVALSYGARQEMINAMQQLARDAASGKITAEQITEQHMEAALYTHDLPAPDLLIRTGGEQRLSNFLLWQAAYTELYFTPVLWPDFTVTHFEEALHDFARRERRYGNTA